MCLEWMALAVATKDCVANRLLMVEIMALRRTAGPSPMYGDNEQANHFAVE